MILTEVLTDSAHHRRQRLVNDARALAVFSLGAGDGLSAQRWLALADRFVATPDAQVDVQAELAWRIMVDATMRMPTAGSA